MRTSYKLATAALGAAALLPLGVGSALAAEGNSTARLRPVALNGVNASGSATVAVSGTTINVTMAANGSIEVPTDFAQPGWYNLGPTPGEFGPAVIAGHVDSKAGPAVFYRLGELKAGQRVKVTRKDGSVATFAIDRVARYAKADFPTTLVYGPTTRAEIRLVTCGGAFDATTGHYVDNIVAFGHLLA